MVDENPKNNTDNVGKSEEYITTITRDVMIRYKSDLAGLEAAKALLDRFAVSLRKIAEEGGDVDDAFKKARDSIFKNVDAVKESTKAQDTLSKSIGRSQSALASIGKVGTETWTLLSSGVSRFGSALNSAMVNGALPDSVNKLMEFRSAAVSAASSTLIWSDNLGTAYASIQKVRNETNAMMSDIAGISNKMRESFTLIDEGDIESATGFLDKVVGTTSKEASDWLVDGLSGLRKKFALPSQVDDKIMSEMREIAKGGSEGFAASSRLENLLIRYRDTMGAASLGELAPFVNEMIGYLEGSRTGKGPFADVIESNRIKQELSRISETVSTQLGEMWIPVLKRFSSFLSDNKDKIVSFFEKIIEMIERIVSKADSIPSISVGAVAAGAAVASGAGAGVSSAMTGMAMKLVLSTGWVGLAVAAVLAVLGITMYSINKWNKANEFKDPVMVGGYASSSEELKFRKKDFKEISRETTIAESWVGARISKGDDYKSEILKEFEFQNGKTLKVVHQLRANAQAAAEAHDMEFEDALKEVMEPYDFGHTSYSLSNAAVALENRRVEELKAKKAEKDEKDADGGGGPQDDLGTHDWQKRAASLQATFERSSTGFSSALRQIQISGDFSGESISEVNRNLSLAIDDLSNLSDFLDNVLQSKLKKVQTMSSEEEGYEETLKEISLLQLQIKDSEESKLDLIRKRVGLLDVEKNIASSISGYYSGIVSLAQNFGAGLTASVSLQMQSIEASKQELNVIRLQMSELSDRMSIEGSSRELQLDMIKLKNEELQVVSRMASETRALRDNWVSAINASVAGQGAFAKFIVTQEKGVGTLLDRLGDTAKLSRQGGAAGAGVGYARSEQYDVSGFISGANLEAAYQTAEDALFDQDVLKDVRRGHYQGRGLIENVENVVEKLGASGNVANAMRDNPMLASAIAAGGVNFSTKSKRSNRGNESTKDPSVSKKDLSVHLNLKFTNVNQFTDNLIEELKKEIVKIHDQLFN